MVTEVILEETISDVSTFNYTPVWTWSLYDDTSLGMMERGELNHSFSTNYAPKVIESIW